MDLKVKQADFERHLIFLNRSSETIKGYKAELTGYLSYFNREPKSITVSEAIDYFNTLKVHSRKTAIAAIKFFYKHCLKSDKFKKLGYPKMPEHVKEVPSPKEVLALINATKNTKHKTMTMMYYTTGMRIMDVINLKWSSVDRANMVFHVKQGKGRKDRIVPLTESMLKQLIIYCKEYGFKCFNSKDYVFKGKSKTKESYSRRSVESFMTRYALAAGIKKKITPHILRYAFACHQLELGTDSLKIKGILGHSSIKTTEGYTRSANITSGVVDLLK